MLCKWLLLVALPQEVITIYSCLTQCIFSFAHHPAVSINNVLKYFYFKAFFCDQYFWDISASWGNSKYCSKNITQMTHQASGHKMIKYWYYQKRGETEGQVRLSLLNYNVVHQVRNHRPQNPTYKGMGAPLDVRNTPASNEKKRSLPSWVPSLTQGDRQAATR